MKLLVCHCQQTQMQMQIQIHIHRYRYRCCGAAVAAVAAAAACHIQLVQQHILPAVDVALLHGSPQSTVRNPQSGVSATLNFIHLTVHSCTVAQLQQSPHLHCHCHFHISTMGHIRIAATRSPAIKVIEGSRKSNSQQLTAQAKAK